MEPEETLYKIILRHDLSTNWVINDPVLLLGEYGIEDDTHRVKRGDGVSKWSQLLYETFGVEDIVTTKVQQNVTDNIMDQVNTVLNTYKQDYINPLQLQVQQNTQDIEALKQKENESSNISKE